MYALVLAGHCSFREGKRLLGLASSLVGGVAETLARGGRVEEAGEHGLDQRAEDDLCAPREQFGQYEKNSQPFFQDLLGLRECHVHDEHELECVVEGEPVRGVDGRLKDGQEGVGDPVLQ